VGAFAGAGSSPLHYAACGGSIPCCQVPFQMLLKYSLIQCLVLLLCAAGGYASSIGPDVLMKKTWC
jgi:hypothetical protein